jgi:hypothetical protein
MVEIVCATVLSSSSGGECGGVQASYEHIHGRCCLEPIDRFPPPPSRDQARLL